MTRALVGNVDAWSGLFRNFTQFSCLMVEAGCCPRASVPYRVVFQGGPWQNSSLYDVWIPEVSIESGEWKDVGSSVSSR